jgi:hypothetical protein
MADTVTSMLDPVRAERRQRRRHQHGGHVLGLDRGRLDADAQAGEQVDQGLLSEGNAAQRSAGAVQPHDETVPDEVVAAHPLHVHDVLDADRGGHGAGRRRGEAGEERKQHPRERPAREQIAEDQRRNSTSESWLSLAVTM